MNKGIRQQMKLIVRIALALLLITGSISVNAVQVSAAAKPAAKPIRVFVQDKEIKPKSAPVIKGGRVYVEFRSVVQALGFNYKYDAAKKQITADTEDVAFKIDLKSGATYINGKRYVFSNDAPMIIANGTNTLVMTYLFSATHYLGTGYYADQKTLKVYEDPFGAPKKSDMRTIRSVIEQHYQGSGASSVTGFEVQSWGTYVTVEVDAALPKGGAELLDRIDHASIEMERQAGGQWTIHNITSRIEYLDYQSLAEKEATVPEADKAAILKLMDDYIKALNEKDSNGLYTIMDPAFLKKYELLDPDEFQAFYEFTYLKSDLKYILEKDNIVSYESSKAVVYTVRRLSDRLHTDYPAMRFYELTYVNKAADGKWYLDLSASGMLHYEVLEDAEIL
jgi:hypothetical protein